MADPRAGHVSGRPSCGARPVADPRVERQWTTRNTPADEPSRVTASSVGWVVLSMWREVLQGPATVEAHIRLLLERLAELIAGLDPQNLDPDRCTVAVTDVGSVLATLVHRTEDVAEISIDCSGRTATVSGDLLGVPDEILQAQGQSFDDWCADVFGTLADALLEHYTLTEYRRNGRLLRTRVEASRSSGTAFNHWTGMLPALRGKTDTTTRSFDYGCQGEPPTWLLRSAIFVIDRTGIVTVYPNQSRAEAFIEAVDVAAGEYSRAYSEYGVVFRIEPHLDSGRLIPTGEVDPEGLSTALRSWGVGPHHLADDPQAYAVHVLASR